ncbi:MAG: S24 family peptidase [Paludisphaera borealis]|uniref:S24 family peptidase n=1 Tax=Paludisphaera borealis TaxID=1387353 RepID=UPI0028409610|nr:S24 family peptidase [Paludisphaera borealis]MDR3618519.1 S24 family peptidase [Paludisphaera borealis]
MARKKTPKVRVSLKASLSRRLREIRQELFGDHGGPELARRLSLPARTWYNYETGVTVPAEVLLAFIEQTGANPMYLISGDGPRYSQAADDRMLSDLSPVELIRRGLEKLERASQKAIVVAPENLPARLTSEFEAVKLFPLDALAKPELDASRIEGHVLAYRHWLANPAQTVGVRMIDDSMNPILPSGSIVAIDRSITNPMELRGRIVAACPDGVPMIRWLDVSGRHLILRPNQAGREFPLVPVEMGEASPNFLIGQVVWSWSRFSES